MRVLLIEDSPKMAQAVTRGLREHGFAVEAARTGKEGMELAGTETYDVVILDLMLPDADGVDLCKRLRSSGLSAPVLMLTALSGTTDKIKGLDAGADDYLTKPFDFDELVARLRALLRRGSAAESAVLRYLDLELDLARRKVTRGGKEIALRQKEISLLEYFMRNPERVLSRASIGGHVWDINFSPFSNVIDVYVSALRRRIDKAFPDQPAMIHTVVGAGYRFGVQQEQSSDAV